MKSTRVIRALLLAPLLLAGPGLASGPVPGIESARMAADMAIYGAVLTQSDSVTREQMQAQFACLEGMRESRLVPLYLQLFQERFSAGELRVIDQFQRTSIAEKLQQNALHLIQKEYPGDFHPDLKVPAPIVTAEEHAQLQRFAATPAGQKYRRSDLIHSGDITGPVAEQLRAALRECIVSGREAR